LIFGFVLAVRHPGQKRATAIAKCPILHTHGAFIFKKPKNFTRLDANSRNIGVLFGL
jgi:hypothetical protein